MVMRTLALLAIACVIAIPVLAQGERYEAAAGNRPTGPVVNGFALALTPKTLSRKLGRPIWVTLEIRNVAGKLQYLIAGPRYNAYDFSIVNAATGGTVQRNPNTTFGSDPLTVNLTGRAVPPSTAFFLDFDLNDLYSFKVAGLYTIRVVSAHVQGNGHGDILGPSNAITLDIQK